MLLGLSSCLANEVSLMVGVGLSFGCEVVFSCRGSDRGVSVFDMGPLVY